MKISRPRFYRQCHRLSLWESLGGLLLDPTNGLGGSSSRKELHTANNYALYDDPSRMLRLIRLKARLAYTVSRTRQGQYDNVREAQLEITITPGGA